MLQEARGNTPRYHPGLWRWHGLASGVVNVPQSEWRLRHAQVAGDASLELQLAACNAVTALHLVEDSLPPEGVPAGRAAMLQVQVGLHARADCIIHEGVKTDGHAIKADCTCLRWARGRP